ncbi:MAG: Na+/H+ antiporter NhaA [Gammaproteobacteria bacterium]
MQRATYPLEPLFGRILTPFERFLKRTTAGGIVLMVTTLLALIMANSPWGEAFTELWEQPGRIGIGTLQLELSLQHWINDAFMALFFLLVGLELKREILVGELSSLKDAALPVAAALGGMLVPALIYYGFNRGADTVAGWGIPMATDIAFAVAILVLLAWRIPRNLIVFLTALAIADDLSAVLVIATFYTHAIDPQALASAAAVMAVLILCNQGGIRHPLPYAFLGVLLWLALLYSGVHATIAGVLLAVTIPARPAFTPLQFNRRLQELKQAFREEIVKQDTPDDPLSNQRMATIAENVEKAAHAVQAPQQRMEHSLIPWVTLVVIPCFALANAGIDFRTIQLNESLIHPVTLGVMVGLVAGKFIGIGGASWIAVTLGIAVLPRGVRWPHIFGVAWLGGIGFTMSLFISQLAFVDNPNLVEQAKLGILLGSVLAATLGLTWLYLTSRKPYEPPG